VGAITINGDATVDGFWTALGVAGGLIFYGRFYVQWIVSEFRKKSVMPIAFWYLSVAGVFVLFPYAIRTQSPLGALGLCFNLVVYTRNLVHIRAGKRTMRCTTNAALHAGLVAVTLTAIGCAAWTWVAEYQTTAGAPAREAARVWGWLAVGLIGQGLFALRFLVQWIATERKKASVVPPAFWQLSMAAAALQGAAFAQRAEWVFAAGMAASIVIYARNLMLIRHQRRHPTADVLRHRQTS